MYNGRTIASNSIHIITRKSTPVNSVTVVMAFCLGTGLVTEIEPQPWAPGTCLPPGLAVQYLSHEQEKEAERCNCWPSHTGRLPACVP